MNNTDIDPKLKKFADALDEVLNDYRTGVLGANAVTYAIAYGMDDSHDLIDPEIDGFDEETLKRISHHIDNLQENRL